MQRMLGVCPALSWTTADAHADLVAARRHRRLWGIGLAVVLVAITINVVITVVRVLAPVPSPPTAPPASAPDLPAPHAAPTPAGPREEDSDLRLSGAGSDVIYLQSAASIERVDLKTGRAVRVSTPELTQFSSFVARPGWALSKTVDNGSGVVVRDGHQAESLPDGLRSSGRAYSAGHDRLWFVPEDSAGGRRTVTQLDLDGHRVADETIALPDEFGIPDTDQDGQLLITNVGGVYRAGPDRTRRLATGQLIAIGSHHVLTWDCDAQARCDAYRTDRTTGRRTELPVDRQTMLDLFQGDLTDVSSYQGVLSPDGTHAALAGPPLRTNERPLVVVDLEDGHHDLLPGSATDTNPNAQVAWTSTSRWLLALTDGQLRAYDTTTRSVRTPTTGGEPLLHLASADAAGF